MLRLCVRQKILPQSIDDMVQWMWCSLCNIYAIETNKAWNKYFCNCLYWNWIPTWFLCLYWKKKDKEVTPILETDDKVICDAGLQSCSGHILYIENYYTSLDITKHLFEQYSWFIAGTLTLSDKIVGEPDDAPFY